MRGLITAGATLMLMLAACNGEADQASANGSSNGAADGNGAGGAIKPAAQLCLFQPDDVREFRAEPGRDPSRPLIVRGEARMERHYRPDLREPKVQGDVLSLWLVKVERNGPVAKDDWQEVTYSHPDREAIRRVVIRCDMERVLAEFRIDGAG